MLWIFSDLANVLFFIGFGMCVIALVLNRKMLRKRVAPFVTQRLVPEGPYAGPVRIKRRLITEIYELAPGLRTMCTVGICLILAAVVLGGTVNEIYTNIRPY